TAGIPINSSLTSDDSKLLFGSLKNTAFDGRVEKNIVDDNMGKVARAAYDRVLNMMNMLVLIVFILIALANILQIQVNAYSFKKLVPGLVLGLILANASFFVVRAMLEVAGYAASGLIAPDTVSKNEKGDDVGGPKMLLEQIEQFGLVVKPGGTFTTDSTGPNMGLVFQQMVMNLFILAAGIMILILGFQFAIRSVIFYAVMPIAPIAFIGLYFPPLGFVWKRWFALIVSWTFMPVVAFFWLWLGFMWLGAVEPKGSGPFAYVINYAFGIAMIYLAMKTPFSMAGEAKQYLSKWNEIGRTVGMRYTPYGAGTRAVKQIAANYATRDKMLDSGPIIQNNVARKLGGDSINVMQKKSELKTQQMKDKIAGIEAAVEGRAIKELVDGKEGLISKWKNSDSKFLSGLGEALDSRNGKIVRAVATGGLSLLPGAYEKVRDSDFGKNVQAGVDKHLVHTGLVDPVSYKSRDGVIKDTKEHGRRLKNEGANSLAKAYYFGPKGVERAREEFEAEANEKDAEKAKSDAKGEAAYRNLQMHIAEGSSVVDKVAAYQRSIGDPSIETVGDLIALKPHKALAGNEALKKEVLGFQLQYKGMYKAGTKHIIGEIKSAAEENGKKDVDEVKFFRTSEINDAGKILRKLDSTALDKFGGYEEIRASDISDYTARMAGLGKIAVNATNIEKRGSAKEALTSLDEILKTDEARLHPEHATFQKEVSDYLEVLKDPKLSPKGIKEASSAFRTGRLYKELNLRTVSPDRNFKSGVVGAHESAESQAQGGGMPTTEEEVR
ncbi:MAG TPA: hypothetical protein VLA04_04475, partial [Verrucomicrobiae bacterium]|nr:hypothetical protein [Verrucomicrobiae bacterium]